MIEVPINALREILGYMENEKRIFDEANNPLRYKPVFAHVANLRKQLSSIEAKDGPGVAVRIVNRPA